MMKYFLAIAGLIFSILLLYANSLSVPFLFDDAAIISDQTIKHFSLLSSIRYRYFFYLSFAINYFLGEFNPFGYHLFNIFFHIATSITGFLIAFLTIDKGVGWGRNAAFRIAIITAFLFALNPVHSETVTYISGRASGISSFFLFLSLLFFILGSLKKTGFARLMLYPLSSIAVTLSMLSKETTIIFPIVVILYDLCFMRGDIWVRRRDRFMFYYLPIAAGIAVIAIKNTESILWLAGKLSGLYAMRQMEIIGFPIKIFFLPIALSFDYGFSKGLDFHSIKFLLSAAFLLVLAVLVAKKFFIKSPILSFAVLWYFIVLLPTNSCIPRLDLFSARNLYLPSFGLSLFFAVAFYRAFLCDKNNMPIRAIGTIALFVILIFNSALTIQRNKIYKTEANLWADALQKSPLNPRALNNLIWFSRQETSK